MQIEKDKSLKEFTTFRIGGKAQFFCVVQNEDEVGEAVVFAQEKKLPIFVLGGGSNILISDNGFAGLVVKMEMNGIEFIDDENGNTRVTVKAGEGWDDFVRIAVEKSLYGIENLSLIPGTVGAAPVQNIGAYGCEVKDTIDTVRVFDTKENTFKDFSNFDCQFGYRDSLFKREAGRYIVTVVTFILKKNGKVNIDYKDVREYFAAKDIENPSLAGVRNAVVEIRNNKLPNVKKVGTAGSYFKNPIISSVLSKELKTKYPELPIYPLNDTHVKVSLAWIIDRICGFKGVVKGNVGTYRNQALVIVNNRNATAAEIISFADEIKKIVKEKTGIEIEEEVQMI